MANAFVIAEAGVNHNADLNLAFEMIEVAAAAGADAIKFQTAIPESVVISGAEKADYQKISTGASESQLEMIRKLHFPLDVYPKLKAFCERKGIIFASTAFDLTSLDLLERIGQPFHKVPSGEITNLPYLRQMGSYGRPIILSTGMATLGEVDAALEVLEEAGVSREEVTILHCTTEYPAPMIDVNLRAMVSMHDAFGVKVGYSDHTEGIEIPIAAVVLGASVIEKHFTLSRELPGPDHKASLEPPELVKMISAIRNIELALGDGVKRPRVSEFNNRRIIRRSIAATRAIKKGELFDDKSIKSIRPGVGLSPMRWDYVVGKCANRDYIEDEFLDGDI
jgi:N,N'-diacetyllegionaminate synthase